MRYKSLEGHVAVSRAVRSKEIDISDEVSRLAATILNSLVATKLATTILKAAMVTWVTYVTYAMGWQFLPQNYLIWTNLYQIYNVVNRKNNSCSLDLVYLNLSEPSIAWSQIILSKIW